MATKSIKPTADRHKPSSMVRIPAALALAMKELANEDVTTLSEQVRAAVREHLIRRGRWPVKSKK